MIKNLINISLSFCNDNSELNFFISEDFKEVKSTKSADLEVLKKIFLDNFRQINCNKGDFYFAISIIVEKGILKIVFDENLASEKDLRKLEENLLYSNVFGLIKKIFGDNKLNIFFEKIEFEIEDMKRIEIFNVKIDSENQIKYNFFVEEFNKIVPVKNHIEYFEESHQERYLKVLMENGRFVCGNLIDELYQTLEGIKKPLSCCNIDFHNKENTNFLNGNENSDLLNEFTYSFYICECQRYKYIYSIVQLETDKYKNEDIEKILEHKLFSCNMIYNIRLKIQEILLDFINLN